MDLLSKNEREKWQAGNHHYIYEKLGSHLTDNGVRFAVWAPHAHSVSVVGTFNNWDGRENPMTKDEETGIWSAQVNNAEHWDLYKYELKTGPDAPPFLKADPYAFYSELRPKNSSIVYDLEGLNGATMNGCKTARPFNRSISPSRFTKCTSDPGA